MARTLEGLRKQKRYFDKDSDIDVNAYRDYLKNNNKWGFEGCPFILEFPYLTTPDMIKDILVHKYLGV